MPSRFRPQVVVDNCYVCDVGFRWQLPGHKDWEPTLRLYGRDLLGFDAAIEHYNQAMAELAILLGFADSYGQAKLRTFVSSPRPVGKVPPKVASKLSDHPQDVIVCGPSKLDHWLDELVADRAAREKTTTS